MEIYQFMHDETAVKKLQARAAEREKSLSWKPFLEIQQLLPQLPERPAAALDLDQAAVRIGEELTADDPDRLMLERAAEAVMPWKKGPFNLHGIEIDAEWRSDFKWDRLKHHLPSQKDKLVLDVGGNNGYHLFRVAHQQPRYLLNIDPVPRLWYQFHLLQRYARIPNFEFAMWGWEELDCWDALWDTIFCMGIVYHHRDPLGIIRNLHNALRPGGLLVMESIVIPGEETMCLFPDDRYAKMRNVWFVPTVSALMNMLRRAKFEDVVEIATNRHEPAEQRTTRWNPGPSYEAFLNPEDPSQTIEGHPAPWRSIIMARKKG